MASPYHRAPPFAPIVLCVCGAECRVNPAALRCILQPIQVGQILRPARGALVLNQVHSSNDGDGDTFQGDGKPVRPRFIEGDTVD